MRAGWCRPLPTAHGAAQITYDHFYDTVELIPCRPSLAHLNGVYWLRGEKVAQ